MKRISKKYDVVLRLLSLVLAFIVWAIVMAEENPERSPQFDDIKVNLSGEDTLLENKGLSVIDMDTDLISVTVKGPNNEVTSKTIKQKVYAMLDVSDITDVGEYELKPNVVVNQYGVEAVRTDPQTVKVRVDRLTTLDVPVRVEVVGSPKDGYRAGQPYATTSKEVSIEGPYSELKEVAYAYATINADGLDTTTKADCKLSLYNNAGNIFYSETVTCPTGSVNVTLPVYEINTVPLKVTLKSGGTVDAEQAKARIEPESVNVIGDKKTIQDMGEIMLGEIDLAVAKTDEPIELPINLPQGVKLDQGQPSNAKVTITLDGVATRKLEVTKFAPNDTAGDSTPYNVTVLTEKVEIELRGSESALETVAEDMFSIGLTFDSESLGAGTHEVKGVVAATALPNGVTLVEGNVTAQIKIEEKNAEG